MAFRGLKTPAPSEEPRLSPKLDGIIFVTLAKLSGMAFFGSADWLISGHPRSPEEVNADEHRFE